MKISTAHQRFAERLRNSRVLEHPDEFLGQNWKNVLNFWLFLDTLTKDQWNSIDDAYHSLMHNERHLAYLAASDAAQVATGYSSAAREAARLAASYAASYAASDAACYAAYAAAGYATWEIMGSHILKEQGKSLVFLPLFLNV